MRLPAILEPLRHRDVRLLLAGQTLTLLGSFVSNIALPLQVLVLGGGATELAALVGVYAAASLGRPRSRYTSLRVLRRCSSSPAPARSS